MNKIKFAPTLLLTTHYQLSYEASFTLLAAHVAAIRLAVRVILSAVQYVYPGKELAEHTREIMHCT